KAPEVINGELYGRLKTKTGMLKYYGYANYNHLGFDKKSIEGKNWQDHFTLFNNHAFSLLTYTGTIKDSWKLSTGAGFSYNKDKISIHSLLHGDTINYFLPRITNYTTQARAVATKNLQGLNKINIGAEYQLVTDKINAMDSIPFITRQDHYASLFTETDLYIGAKFVTRLGMRFEHSSLLNDNKFSPRLSLAYKLGGHGQVSAAYGDFYQKPDVNLLFRYPNLKFTKATHYLLNYQRMADGQTIRLELFHKEYQQLVTFNAGNSFDLRNEGSGYARGIELFWRDKKTFKNFSYWIAYSFLDTKRQFLDYPVKVQPSFAAKHTANLVMKQWVEKIAAMFSLTYTYASGRPYYNPNLSKEDFMKDRTIAYHNMGLQVNYLTTIGKANAVLIFNTNNVLGSDQVYSYRFAANKNIAGSYNGEAVTPMARRFYFIGIYLSMGSDRRKEIIDN
ncbi:MAG: TonB-dependent receptor plug domain-containing protein, partial [Chitinophagaceae bacterium]